MTGVRQCLTWLLRINWDRFGTWSVRALGFVDDDNPFVAYRPGRPAVVLYRSFQPDSIFKPDDEVLAAACTERPPCTDSFGVEVRK